ncbi:hypothetical protein BC829DRAFT_436746 [Chytridium lagenaria]|nr:hypothetical protein BC829DRAFT_436746 [Chytridium lagenaria]
MAFTHVHRQQQSNACMPLPAASSTVCRIYEDEGSSADILMFNSAYVPPLLRTATSVLEFDTALSSPQIAMGVLEWMGCDAEVTNSTAPRLLADPLVCRSSGTTGNEALSKFGEWCAGLPQDGCQNSASFSDVDNCGMPFITRCPSCVVTDKSLPSIDISSPTFSFPTTAGPSPLAFQTTAPEPESATSKSTSFLLIATITSVVAVILTGVLLYFLVTCGWCKCGSRRPKPPTLAATEERDLETGEEVVIAPSGSATNSQRGASEIPHDGLQRAASISTSAKSWSSKLLSQKKSLKRSVTPPSVTVQTPASIERALKSSSSPNSTTSTPSPEESTPMLKISNKRDPPPAEPPTPSVSHTPTTPSVSTRSPTTPSTQRSKYSGVTTSTKSPRSPNSSSSKKLPFRTSSVGGVSSAHGSNGNNSLTSPSDPKSEAAPAAEPSSSSKTTPPANIGPFLNGLIHNAQRITVPPNPGRTTGYADVKEERKLRRIPSRGSTIGAATRSAIHLRRRPRSQSVDSAHSSMIQAYAAVAMYVESTLPSDAPVASAGLRRSPSMKSKMSHRSVKSIRALMAAAVAHGDDIPPVPAMPYVFEPVVVPGMPSFHLAIVMEEFEAFEEDEIELKPGDVVQVHKMFDDGWALV